MKDDSNDGSGFDPMTAPSGGMLELDSADLFQGRTELLIRHRGEQYRLRVTRQDKLILTK